MALVAAVPVTLAGPTLTYAAASGGGDKFVPDDNTFLLIKNASGSSITATIATPYAPLGLALADLVITVAAGAENAVGPFAPPYWANSAGQADITWSLATSVTWLPVRN
jgi:hypothetical protein